MALTRLWLGAELRARWRLHLVLALLIGVVGTVVLTAAAGARTTASAYERFKDRQAIPDVEFDSQQADARAAISHLPGVRSAGAFAAMFMAPGKDLLPGQDFLVFGAADHNYGRVVDRPIVLEGRMPRPDATDEVVVNESGRSVSKLGVGSTTTLRSMSPDDGKLLNAGHFDEIKFAGPTPTVRVVGVVRTTLDLSHVSYAKNYFVAGPAFYEAYGPGVFYFTEPQLDVRLQRPGGAEKFVGAARESVQQFPESASTFNGRAMAPVLAAVRNATRIQALSLGLVALAAAIAGLLGLALMTARSVAGMSDDFPSLRAMGVAKPGRAGLAAATFLPAAAAGVVLALIGATLASPLFPTAVARRLGPSPGIRFDAVTLLPGALVLVVVVLGSAAFSAYRWRPLPVTQGGLYVGPFDRLAGTLPPSPRIGVRWALPRRDAVAGRGRAAVAGAVIGVIALVAAVTYAAGLRHLVTTPSAYGWTFDVVGSEGNDAGQAEQTRDALLQHPGVGDVGLVRIVGSAIVDDSANADVYGFESVRGSFGPAVLSGRAPVGQDEILLATKTAGKLHKGVGQDVTLLLGPGAPPVKLHVVGVGLLPTIESDQVAVGAAMTKAGLEHIPAEASADIQQVFAEESKLDTILRVAPGVDRRRTVGQLNKEDLVSYFADELPGDIRNLDLVRAYPLWLAGFLAAIGLFTVGNALVVSARKRSQQVGILRALGLTRGQIVGAVSSQGATMCVVGALIGVPLGIALGRWTWAASARQLGVGEGLGAPMLALLALVLFAVVLLGLLGATAGWFAGRATPSDALRVP